MSEYNNDSNDDLPYDDEGVEAASPEAGQYVENQYAEQTYDADGYAIPTQPTETYAEGAYTEQAYAEPEYVEPQAHDYYTSDFQNPATGEAPQTEYAEPSIFTDQNTENYAEDSNLYATDQTETYGEYEEPSAYKQHEEYVEYSETGEFSAQNDYVEPEVYVAADEYLESTTTTPSQNQYTQEYATEPVAEYTNAYVEPQAPVAGYASPQATDQYAQEQPYEEQNYSTENYTDQDYVEQDYVNAGGAETSYVEQPYDASLAAGADPSFSANETQFSSPAQYDETSRIHPDGTEALGGLTQSHIQTDGLQQDFRQEYEAEVSPKRVFPTGWMVTGISLILLMGIGFYYLYDQYIDVGGTSDVPVLLADKTPIKNFPNGDISLNSNGTKNTDRLPNTTNNTGTGTSSVTNVTPSLLDSREEVIDQSPKSEDRVETSNNVVADNDDKDIQNVLSLIKSSANNVEILLKSDDVSQLDQNQISIDGLETVLVNAKPVKLSDLINQTNQQPETTIEQVAVANVDDLPVVSEGTQDPFKDVVANTGTQIASNTASELPEATEALAALPEAVNTDIQLLPETDLSNAISIASNQPIEPINIVTDAPKPLSRPAVPKTVPNTVSPQAASTAGGAYGVQLSSLPSEASARQAFAKISSQYPNILAGYSVIIREAIIPGKGTFYRVFAGPISTYNAANQVCATLRAAGGDCLAKKM